MPCCAMYGCKSYSRKTRGTEIKYYRFPKDEELRKKWYIACRRQDITSLKDACICSLHFQESDFQSTLKHQLLNYMPRNHRNLKPDAIPIAADKGINVAKVKSTRYKKYTKSDVCISPNTSQQTKKDKKNNTLDVLKNKILLLEKENRALKIKNQDLMNSDELDIIDNRISEQEVDDPDYDPMGEVLNQNMEVIESNVQNMGDKISASQSKQENEDCENSVKIFKLKCKKVDALARIADELDALCDVLRNRPKV